VTPVDLPAPVARPDAPPAVDAAALEAALVSRVDGEVRFDDGSRAAYSTDASNFRQVPIGVVVPRSVEAAVETVAVCRGLGAPVLSRGGGTSLAGECCNAAVVIDWSKYCDALVSVDAGAKTCVVEPGIVLDVLNRKLERAERVLLPRVRESDVDTVVMADGFSCRTELHQLDSGGREAIHLAEVLLAAQRGDPAATGERPERAYALRPAEPSRAARGAALVGLGSAAGGVAALAAVAAYALGRRRAAAR
jgi:FAD binding domain